MKIAVIGAGWAGMAAAVEATLAGHSAVVFEASRAIGGRARAITGRLPDGTPVTLDNGQHILLGAYSETLRLLRVVGVDPAAALLRLPMTLRFPDGHGLRFPSLPTPLDALAAIVTARGWSLSDKWSLLRLASGWQGSGFQCDASASVLQLCHAVRPRVMAELIEPLCVSALNTPARRASAQVFLRVLHDALFDVQGGSGLLLPRVTLSELFPNAAAQWLSQRAGQFRLGARVESVLPHGPRWQVNGEVFDAVVFAVSASESVCILENSAPAAPDFMAIKIRKWTQICRTLQFEAITTVYAWGPSAALAHPMLMLHSSPDSRTPAPAQFVFDRGQLGGPAGLLAFVASASTGERATLQAQVLVQAEQQLGLRLQAVQTIVEKRATFACTPGLQRPTQQIIPGWVVCGDYVAGPYPATLEGALRSAVAGVKSVLLDAFNARPESTIREPVCVGPTDT